MRFSKLTVRFSWWSSRCPDRGTFPKGLSFPGGTEWVWARRSCRILEVAVVSAYKYIRLWIISKIIQWIKKGIYQRRNLLKIICFTWTESGDNRSSSDEPFGETGAANEDDEDDLELPRRLIAPPLPSFPAFPRLGVASTMLAASVAMGIL